MEKIKTIELIINSLNNLLKIDPSLVNSIVLTKKVFTDNQDIIDHPYIIVDKDNRVGFVGMLNGILELSENQRIGYVTDKKDNNILKFGLIENGEWAS